MNEFSFKKFGWTTNPFTFKIDPTLFTGYTEQVKAILEHISNRHKIALITGPTGSGKTTFLKWLETNVDGVAKLYISKPPEKAEDFINIFTDIFPPSFWERILKRAPTLFNLPAYVNKKLKGVYLLFLLDEAHEIGHDILEWLRVLTDQINMSLIMAGLPALEQNIKVNLETLNQRITTRINLIALDKSESRQLIQKRIQSVGGSGISPFTDSAIDVIYNRTGGFPREVLRLCDKLITDVAEKGLDLIDNTAVESYREFKEEIKFEQPAVTFVPTPPSETHIRDLPYKQRKILELLSKVEWLTPTAIAEQLDFKSYKSRGHAIRSMNNILHRLMLEGFVQRETKGKAYMYALTPKVKTIFVTS